ncbi:MAG TPA: alpha/beta fold hydrolase [Pyrinomonadaceae bacterium]|jgi:pimeloyl-ACP methyl ester carboxylesterase
MGKGSARVRGIEMAYDETGAAWGGDPLVLLHGFPFDRSMWRGQLEALGGEFRVVAPDLRGFGETTFADGMTMESMAEDVAALLDELGLVRVVLGGLSMGGYVAFEFLRKFRGRVRALVLADTRPQADADDARRAREENAQRALREGMEPIVGTMLPKLLAAGTRERGGEVVEGVRAMMLGTSPETAAAALRAMAMRRDQTDLLPSIKVPALIVVGAEDSHTPPSDAEAMSAKIEGSRLVVIEGAGHLSNVERPEEFNRALVEFMRGLPEMYG